MSVRPDLPATGRIRLRALSTADVHAQLQGQDAHIVRWLSGTVNTAEEHRQALAQAEHEWRIVAHRFDLGIEVTATGALAGLVGIQSRMPYLERDQVNITYALYPQFRGQGVASEAVRLAQTLAATLFDARELVIRTDPDNTKSAAVALRLDYRLTRRTDDDHGVLDWYTLPVATLDQPATARI